jgi:hypothetical protein
MPFRELFRGGGLDLGLPTKARHQVSRRGYGGQQPPVCSDFCDLRLKVMLKIWIFIPLPRKSRYALSGVIYWGGGGDLDLGLPTKARQQVPRRGYGGQQPPVCTDFEICRLKVMLTIWIFSHLGAHFGIQISFLHLLCCCGLITEI